VIATILGVSVTIGYGVSQFSSGMFNITGANWMMDAEGARTKTAMILSLLVVMGASTLSAMSGVGRGIKWLSNINMSLSLFILVFFILFGSTMFVFKSFFVGIYDYLIAFPRMSLEVWSSDGSDVSQKLADWQGGWTIFYWA
jgi:choline-glycine betaine transporter